MTFCSVAMFNFLCIVTYAVFLQIGHCAELWSFDKFHFVSKSWPKYHYIDHNHGGYVRMQYSTRHRKT